MKRLLMGFFCITSLLVTACQKSSDSAGESSGSSTLTVTGTIGSGLNGQTMIQFTKEFIESLLSSDSPFAFNLLPVVHTADSVLAVPLYQGKMNVWAMAYAIAGTIDGSGNMSIALNKNQDFVILLLDSTQTQNIDKVVGYLNLSDTGKGLMRIPVEKSKSSTLDVGTVTEESGSSAANSSHSLTDLTDQFNVNIGLLREFARTDDILQMAKNIYANYHSNTEYYDTSPYFAFNGSQTGMATDYTTPESIPYSGYGLYFNIAKPGLKIGDVCAASGARQLTLTPPTSITSAVDPRYGGTGTTFTSVDNTGVSGTSAQSATSVWCGGTNNLGAGSIYIHGNPDEETFGFNWGAGNGFAGSIAAGNWILSLDNTEIARFDLNSASVVDSNNHPTVYVPSLKIDKDGSGVITSISAKIYTWDSTTSSFVQVTDPSGFIAVAQDLSLSITDYGQDPRVDKMYTLVHQGNGVFTVTDFDGTTWKQGDYNTGTAQFPSSNSIVFTYSLYGASIRFDFR